MDPITIDFYDGRKKKVLNVDMSDSKSLTEYLVLMASPNWTRIVFKRARPKPIKTLVARLAINEAPPFLPRR